MTETKKIVRKKRVMPRDTEITDSVRDEKMYNDRRAFDILYEAQRYWSAMSRYRKERSRNLRYVNGDQWGDMVYVKNKHASMTEREYIESQGNVALTNNLISGVMRRVMGVFRSQDKEPTCVARDRDEQEMGEVMSTVMQANRQKNQRRKLDALALKEFVTGGLVVHRKWYGSMNGTLDCWTSEVPPEKFFVDTHMRDSRTWDCSFVGEIHDCSFGEVLKRYSHSPQDKARLTDIYSRAAHRESFDAGISDFGYATEEAYDFLLVQDPGRCRVIEVWRLEYKDRIRCYDPAKGQLFKVEIEDYHELVEEENAARLALAREQGIPEDDVALILSTDEEYPGCGWFTDDYWYYYMLSPFGDILEEGETPYAHHSHPYVFEAYPCFTNIHPFLSDIVDQQRYVNRLVTMWDWIMRASAKGVLMFPEDCKPSDMSMDEIAEEWTSFNGMIVYKPSRTGAVPQQIANNSTNIGITELLNIQLKFLEDIGGVTQALQGKPGFAGESAAHYDMQTENATKSLLDLMESMDQFIENGAYKDLYNILQYYPEDKLVGIAGDSGHRLKYDPKKLAGVEFEIAVTQMKNTPAYRAYANDVLTMLYQTNAITAKMMLENGDFPFADKLIQSIEAEQQRMENGELPQGISPELMQQARQGANMNAVSRMYGNRAA